MDHTNIVAKTMSMNNTYTVDIEEEDDSFPDHRQTTNLNPYYDAARTVETYVVPVTCVVGIVCNILAVKTFLHKGIRKYSCSMFLVVKCLSDTMFLMNLLGIYLSGCFNINVNTAANICKIVIFITYVSGFVSVWTVILVSAENFIRIRYPYEVKRLCTTNNAALCIIVLILSSLCINSFSLWISDKHCSPVSDYSTITQAFIYIDTLLTLVLPSILLTGLLFAIISKLCQHSKGPSQQHAKSRRSGSHVRQSESRIAAVTRMLLAVSLTFFLLTVTSHIVRIKLLITTSITGNMKLTKTEAAVQIIAQLFYYSGLATNLFILLLFGENFRKVFKNTYMKESLDTVNLSEAYKDHVTTAPSDETHDCDDTVNGLGERDLSCLVNMKVTSL